MQNKCEGEKVKCAICGYKRIELQHHHILSKKNGGSDEYYNIIHLCPTCHVLMDRKSIGGVGECWLKQQKLTRAEFWDRIKEIEYWAKIRQVKK